MLAFVREHARIDKRSPGEREDPICMSKEGKRKTVPGHISYGVMTDDGGISAYDDKRLQERARMMQGLMIGKLRRRDAWMPNEAG